jgi:hypothetical protein
MHVLLNYCIQLDFAGHRLRFLAADTAHRAAWGALFPLIDVGDGCVAITGNLAGADNSGSLVDTGYRGDGFLTPELFQRWTNHATLPAEGEARSPNALLGGESYSNIQLNGESLLVGDPPRKLNGIGLYFLARHLVTFDFPSGILYLKRTSIGPLVDEDTKAVADQAVRTLVNLKRKGHLPGWSRKDHFANKTEPIELRYPDAATFNHVLKKGDSSIYHYELSRPTQSAPWRLQKAWRSDPCGQTIEEYPVDDSKGPG